MLKLGNLKVRFFYNEESTGRKSTTSVVSIQGKSSKQIDDKILGKGKVKLHQNDTFDKNKGRKRSLRLALNESPLTKEERSAVWGQYDSQIGLAK